MAPGRQRGVGIKSLGLEGNLRWPGVHPRRDGEGVGSHSLTGQPPPPLSLLPSSPEPGCSGPGGPPAAVGPREYWLLLLFLLLSGARANGRRASVL